MGPANDLRHGTQSAGAGVVNRRLLSSRRPLLVLTGLYCLASFTHFFHNAEFCGEYPNLPVWISRSTVYLSWLGITAIGGAGVWFTWSRRPLPGLGLLALYALLGFAGLGHYTRAPIARHTLAMNLAIWFEVIAGALLLTIALKELWAEHRRFARVVRSVRP